MNQSTMEAYAEVDTILSFMDKELVEQIPEKLRKMFKERKATEYVKKINPNLPIEDQFLNDETLSILAVLNYNYWCKDEQKKAELLNTYAENEKVFQESLREKYNPDDIFKSKNSEKTETIQESVELIEYKEPKWYQKLFKKILGFFRK